MVSKNRCLYSFIRAMAFTAAAGLCAIARAQSTTPFFNFEGQLTDSSGTPVTDSAAVFVISITDPSSTGDCVLYQEQQTVDLSATNGAFNLAVGKPGAVRTPNDPGISIEQVFKNTGQTFTHAVSCPVGYTSAADDFRNIKITVNAGGTTETLGPVSIGSAPTSTIASTAQTLQGKAANQFLQTKVSGTNELSQANLEAVFSSPNRSKLMDLINGTSAQFITSTSLSSALTNLANPTDDQHAATKQYCDMNIGGKEINSTSLSTEIGNGVGDGKVLTWDAAGNKWVAEDPVTGMDNLGNHTATQDLDMDGNRITNMADPANAQDAVTKNYVDTKLITRDLPAAPAAGQDQMSLKYDHGAGAWVYYTPIAAGADNMGDHAATQNIELGPNWLSRDGDDEGLSITADGKIGVGTDDPASLLHVKNGTGTAPSIDAGTTLTVQNNAAAGDNSIIQIIGGTSGMSSIRFGDSNGNANATISAENANSALLLNTSGAERLRITGTGNVGIGTTNPTTKLEVAGTVTATEFVGDGAGLSNVNGTDSSKVAKAGDTMTGSLAMSTNKITGLGDPTAAQDAVTKNYSDTKFITRNLPTIPGAGQTGQSLKYDGAGAWQYYTPVEPSRTIAAGTGLTGGGDLSANRTLSLSNTPVTAGNYGSAMQVGTFTVDAQGRLTSAGNVTISGTSPGGTAGGDLTGTYPDPVVSRIQGNPVSSGFPTAGQMLRWSGSQWQASNDASTLTSLNANQLSAGTMPVARLPAFTGGDVTSTAGSANLAIGTGRVNSTHIADGSVGTADIALGAVTTIHLPPTNGAGLSITGSGLTVSLPQNLHTFVVNAPGIYFISMNLTRIWSSTPWGFVGFQLWNETTSTFLEPAGSFNTYDYKITNTGYALSRNFIYNKTTTTTETLAIRWLTGSSSTAGSFIVTIDSWDGPGLNGWASNFNVIHMKR